jgi:hypothetical protein
MRKTTLVIALTTLLSWASLSLHGQTLTGLQLWLKPDGLTNTVNLSKVSYWTNSVGSGSAATNDSLANQPTYVTGGLNGHPVVRFLDDGSNQAGNPNLDWLVSPLPLSGNSNSFTATIVFESQITGVRDTLIQQLGNGATIFYLQTNSVPSLNPQIISFASNRELPSPYSYAVRNWTILTIVQDAAAGTVTLYQNGFALTNTAIGTLNTLANAGWLLGCNKNKSTHGLNGDIAEVLIYDTALSDGDRGATENYLANKYGFVVFTDNFNTPDTFDLEADLATRQSGSAAPAGYYYNTAEITNNEVKLTLPVHSGFQTRVITPKVNFITNETGNFKLEYDITSLTQVGDCWAGLIIRSASQLANPIWGDGFNTIIRSNGNHIVFPGGFFGPPWFVGTFTNTTFPIHVELIANNNLLNYFINGEFIGNWQLPCGAANYISLSLGSDSANTVTFDNFSFTATPTAYELLPNLPSSLKLADTFNTADNADINDNLNARQTGSAANISWSTAGSTNSTLSIAGNTLFITNSPTPTQRAYGTVSPLVDFRQLEHLNSFRLRFKVSGTNSNNSNDTWIGLRLRDTQGGRTVDAADGGGTAINLFTGDGRWFLFQSVLGDTNAITFPASGAVTVADTYDFDVEVRNNVMRMKINGVPLLLGCGSETYLLSPAQTANFITLQCFAETSATDASATFDDFQFESLDPGFAIPTPSIADPAHIGSGFRFSVNADNNTFYAVDSTTDLGVPTWTYLGGFVGDGGLFNYTNSPATNAQQFYRVRVP